MKNINTVNSSNRIRFILIHIVCWLLYFCFTNFIFFAGNGYTIFVNSGLHQGVVTLFVFYTNALFIAPKLISQKQYFLLVISGVLIIGVFIFLRYLLDFVALPFLHIQSTYSSLNHKFFFESLWIGLLYLLLSYGYTAALYAIKLEKDNRRMIEQKLVLEQENSQLLQEKNLLEMSFLRMQIKPHFMHNVLSSIYTRVHKVSPESAGALMGLTDLLRYTTQTSRYDEKVWLRDELENMQLYLSLQKFRFGENFHYQYLIEGDADDLRILPLVLLSFIENAIKYGDLSEPKNPLAVQVVIVANHLTFSCFNLKSYQHKANTFSSGVGLENIYKRLAKVYTNENFKLIINESEKDYRTLLTINLI